ncbi:MAG: right-handed parallel beta-helix repeat-containing protein [Acetobacteraceae bacterium]|nr:right-handed parallel beta-helix repeat-containing protein [Acetobacteraceae bacterium]
MAAAVAASQDGDTIDVLAGTYINDFATIKTKITIQGVGGMAHFVATQPPPNGKAILVTDTDVTINNLEFSGTQVPDGNGAGIRYEGGNLVINNSYFHDNQDGLLAAADPSGSITINNSEFAHNGTGDGYTHNLYVGEVGSLTITGSYFHDAVVGHEIKSRALNTTITNSRIVDGPTGTASYSIDLPNGGNAKISNNIIEKGPDSQNPAIIHFGGPAYAGSSLDISNNTILNDLNSPSTAAVLSDAGNPVSFTDNQVYGLTSSQLVKGQATTSGTVYLTTEPTISTDPAYVSPGPVNSAPPSPPPPITQDTLVLHLSASGGPATFSATLDGQTLTDNGVVTASQANGQTQDVTFAGTFGSGAHFLVLDFLGASNSANAAQLTVNGINFDGQEQIGSAVALMPQQSAAFMLGMN